MIQLKTGHVAARFSSGATPVMNLGELILRGTSTKVETVKDADGAMHNHGPISYTTVDVRNGKMPSWYNVEIVRHNLLKLKEQAGHFDQLAAAQTQPATATALPSGAPSRPTPASSLYLHHWSSPARPCPAASITDLHAELPVVTDDLIAVDSHPLGVANQLTSAGHLARGRLAGAGQLRPRRASICCTAWPRWLTTSPASYVHLGNSCTDFTPPPKTIH